MFWFPVFPESQPKVLKPPETAYHSEGHQHYAHGISSNQHKQTREGVAGGELLPNMWSKDPDDDTDAGMGIQDLINNREECIHEVDGMLLIGRACIVVVLEHTVKKVTDKEAKN